MEVPPGGGKKIIGDLYRIEDKNFLWQVDRLEAGYVRWPILVEDFDEEVMAYLSDENADRVRERGYPEIGVIWPPPTEGNSITSTMKGVSPHVPTGGGSPFSQRKSKRKTKSPH